MKFFFLASVTVLAAPAFAVHVIEKPIASNVSCTYPPGNYHIWSYKILPTGSLKGVVNGIDRLKNMDLCRVWGRATRLVCHYGSDASIMFVNHATFHPRFGWPDRKDTHYMDCKDIVAAAEDIVSECFCKPNGYPPFNEFRNKSYGPSIIANYGGPKFGGYKKVTEQLSVYVMNSPEEHCENDSAEEFIGW